MTIGFVIAMTVIVFAIILASASYVKHDPELSEWRRRREEARNRQREFDESDQMNRRPD